MCTKTNWTSLCADRLTIQYSAFSRPTSRTEAELYAADSRVAGFARIAGSLGAAGLSVVVRYGSAFCHHHRCELVCGPPLLNFSPFSPSRSSMPTVAVQRDRLFQTLGRTFSQSTRCHQPCSRSNYLLCVSTHPPMRAPLLCSMYAADAQFEDLCFEFGIELDDVVSTAQQRIASSYRASAAAATAMG